MVRPDNQNEIKYIKIGKHYYNGFSPVKKGKITVVADQKDALGSNNILHQIRLIKHYMSQSSNKELQNEAIIII